MSFDRPLALLALLLVPAALAAWLRYERHRRASAARFANLALLPNLVDRGPGRARFVPLGLLSLGLAALAVGMAKPHATLTVPRKNATVVLAIDVSRSMGAADVAPTRLAAAKSAASAFLDEIPAAYSVALVAFGSRAFVAVPPTQDRQLVRDGLTSLHPGEGTAIGDAVAVAVRLAQRQKAIDGVVPPTSVLLISDGARDGGRTAPQAAAQRARTLHVPVSTVLVGTPDGVVTARLVGGYTERIRVPPSPTTLQQIAKTSGGRFFRARTASALSTVYKRLATRIGHRTENRQITDMFAGGALVLLLAGGALSTFRFRRVVP